jgi:hypothetical protein
MNLDDELKRLGLLGDAEQSFSARLDEIENDPTPRFVRMVSAEPKDGYNWEAYTFHEGGHYVEGDVLFRERIKIAMAPKD